MLTKEITYEDIDGETQTETFWFQLTEAEVTRNMIAGGEDGETYEQRLTRLANITEEDLKQGVGRQVMDTFESILKDAVGKREGKHFIKNKEIQKDFMYSGAYDAFFMEMLMSPDSGAAVIKAMLPNKAQASIDQAIAKREVVLPNSGTIESVSTGKDEPKWLAEKRYPTDAEMQGMDKNEMLQAFKAKSDKLFG